MAEDTTVNFIAAPTIAKFMMSDAFGRLMAGPIGSGKTTGMIMELAKRAAMQASASDGVRYTRFAIVRQTLKQLHATVLKDCRDWLGRVADWRVTESTLYVRFGDVHSEWCFIPLEKPEDQARLLSMQLTAAWMSECIEMDYDVVAPLTGRLGRYPNGNRGVPTWHGLIADTNFPTEMTPWHRLMEYPPNDWQIFRQPSGLDMPVFDANGVQIGGAENLNNLLQTEETKLLPYNHPRRIAQGRKYYERFVQMYGEESDWVRRYVKAMYGNDPSGQAVFRATFNPSFHVVEGTNLIPGYPIIVGQDFGRNPWSIICQVDHMGRLIIHEEVPATNVGLEKHVTEKLKPLLLSKYINHRICVVGDPSGTSKGNIAEETCFEALTRLGLANFPAPTNDVEPRLRAVEALLLQQRGGGPAVMFNRHGCPFLIRAMSGGYRFKKMKSGALRTVPDKDDPEGFSHVADALQYACLVVHGGLVDEISRRLYKKPRRRPEPLDPRAWT